MYLNKQIMKRILSLYLVGITITTYTQSNNLVGVWQEDIQDTNCYYIATNEYLYSVYDFRNMEYWSIDKYYYGFIDNEADSLSIAQFSDSGRYFVLTDADLDKEEMYDKSYFLIYGTNIQSKYNDFGSIELEGPKFFMYSRIERLNGLLEKKLQKKSPDVFAEYLTVTNRKEIIIPRSYIYSEPDSLTRMYFIKGDIVTVLEKQDGWLKVEYNGRKPVTGWIRKQDVGGE
jgi:hypothetical protein